MWSSRTKLCTIVRILQSLLLKGSLSGTGSTQPHEYNWGVTLKKSNGSGLENREYGHRNPSRWPRDTLYPQKLALTLPTSGGRSVGIFHSRTKTTEFNLVERWTVCTPLSVNVFVTLATKQHLEYYCKAVLEIPCITSESHIEL
jgi:hypothetical protein